MFLLYVQVEVYQNIKPRYWQLDFTLHEAFLKTKKGLELVSLPRFVHGIWRKLFLTLYTINWSNFIAWILNNICIKIICFLFCDVINLEINLSFLMQPFSYMSKKSGRKCKYCKNEKSFKHEMKNIFHHF